MALLVQPSKTACWILFFLFCILIFIYYFKYETVVRSKQCDSNQKIVEFCFHQVLKSSLNDWVHFVRILKKYEQLFICPLSLLSLLHKITLSIFVAALLIFLQLYFLFCGIPCWWFFIASNAANFAIFRTSFPYLVTFFPICFLQFVKM